MFKLLQTALVLFMVSRAPGALASPSTGMVTNLTSTAYVQANSQRFYRDLKDLYAIAPSRSDKALQPWDDFDQLYSQAPQAQLELEQLTRQVALSANAEPLLPGIKSRERAQAKLYGELDGDASRLTDLARASLVADEVGDLVAAFEQLERQVEILAVKNRFKTPKANGYRDLNVLVRLPQSEMVAEVQLHLSAIAEIKNGAEHEIYETLQAMEREAQHRPLSEFEQARAERLALQSKDLYLEAWHRTLSGVQQSA
ncbi:RelA/SpoT domain-containing protein [Ferrimonas balearica]|uniref:RelA/SpoT domain-containing protein n=1 Tax=Ferrimonas balearica TaxID=44012 RepID=UPI001C990D5B|nr:RelA/SpoT domain-containing protein [Ferrimonas balearica]MBY5990784.1 RelA/SpoT domain-containing protein [Ferrimonas balearica]